MVVSTTEVINSQYPHFLYKRADAESTQDENGSWTTGAASYELCGRCREETGGRGSKVQTASGNYREFSSLVQLPTSVKRIPEGTEVVVTTEEVPTSDLLSDSFVQNALSEGIVRIAGECLKFDNGRLHNRLWV